MLLSSIDGGDNRKVKLKPLLMGGKYSRGTHTRSVARSQQILNMVLVVFVTIVTN
jgi:hypothetical protein